MLEDMGKREKWARKMRKLIWIWRYAARLNQLGRVGFFFSISLARDAYDDWKDDNPEWVAEEEISYWTE